MADERYGPWASLTIGEARDELADCPAPWWFTGGIALELFAGRSWRGHDDLDIGIRRRDVISVLGHLRQRGWDVIVAAAAQARSHAAVVGSGVRGRRCAVPRPRAAAAVQERPRAVEGHR